MNTRLLSVKVSAPEPGSILNEVGIVDADTHSWFHGHIASDTWVDYSWGSRDRVRVIPGGDPTLVVFEMLHRTINALCGNTPDNPGDFQYPSFSSDLEADLAWFEESFRRIGLPDRFARAGNDTPEVHRSLGAPDALTFILSQKNLSDRNVVSHG